MFIKGENTAKDYKAEGKTVRIGWDEEEVWSVEDGAYLKGSEYEKKYGMPRRKYIIHDGREMLYCEYLKCVPKEKTNNILIGYRNKYPIEIVDGSGLMKGGKKVRNEFAEKILYR